MTTVCSTAVCGTGGWNGPLPGDPDNSSILTATAEFGGIQLSWTLPSTNAHAVAYTNIYRSIGDDFATAIPFTAISGTGYFDFQAGKVIRQYFYWIQHVSVNGTVLEPIGPASATAMPQIDQVIAALTGRIESSALATALRERIDVITDLENGLTQINTKVTTDNNVFAQELTALRNELTGALAYIDSQQTISINERQALVTSLNTQLAQFGDGMYAAIQDEATTRADETGDLFAQKTLKIDLAGNVAGYGLSARVDPTGQFTSDFQVRADTFSVAPPSISSNTAPSNPYQGMVWVDTSVTPNVTKWYNNVTAAWQTTPVKGAVPFVVRTAPETIDGYTVPAGVYMDSAYITRLNANQIDTRGLVVRDLNGAPVIQMGTAIDWSKLGGAAPNLSGLGYSGALDATKGAPAGTYVGNTLAENVESTAGAQAKVSAAQAALQAYTDAETAAAEVRAKAYADGVVTAEETRAIADAQAKADAARVAAINAAALDASSKATAAQTAAQDYAAAQAALAGVSAKAYADGVVDAEEARAIADAQAKADAAKDAAIAAAALDATAKSNAAQTAAQAYAEAQASLAEVTAKAYADGVVDAEEARAIADATAKANAAKDAAISAAAADATTKANNVKATVEAYAASQAALAETQAKAYADGVVDAEEARAIADATAKAEAARVAAVNAAALDATDKANAAQSAAISSAATDATTKANAVLATSLQKAGDAITGPVTFATNGGILAATNADNGVFMGPNGLVGKKAGATTFAIDTAGNASFGGTLNVSSAASGARMEIKNNVIKVFDSTGALRVQIGDLAA